MSEAASLELLPQFVVRVRAAPIAWCPFTRPTFDEGRLVVTVLVTRDGRLVHIPVSEKAESILRAARPAEGLAGWLLLVAPNGEITVAPRAGIEAART